MQGFPTNTLYLIKCGRFPLEWKEIKSSNASPSPRYNHSMNYCEDLNIIIVFGGRCDFANKKNNYQQILDDVWILFLENLNWY